MNNKKQDQQLAALLSSLAIIGFSLVYWAVQIQGVREMLAMAYG
jgi:Na+/proline symporter